MQLEKEEEMVTFIFTRVLVFIFIGLFIVYICSLIVLTLFYAYNKVYGYYYNPEILYYVNNYYPNGRIYIINDKNLDIKKYYIGKPGFDNNFIIQIGVINDCNIIFYKNIENKINVSKISLYLVERLSEDYCKITYFFERKLGLNKYGLNKYDVSK